MAGSGPPLPRLRLRFLRVYQQILSCNDRPTVWRVDWAGVPTSGPGHRIHQDESCLYSPTVCSVRGESSPLQFISCAEPTHCQSGIPQIHLWGRAKHLRRHSWIAVDQSTATKQKLIICKNKKQENHGHSLELKRRYNDAEQDFRLLLSDLLVAQSLAS